jgi:DGQHR domain-containing protein
LDFKKYILQPNTSTIPLIFNLRDNLSNHWKIFDLPNHAILELLPGKKSMAMVDCQHRLGELNDIDVSLSFMCFIGLELRAEIAMFSIINSKAKGLSTSLIDFHETKLLFDVQVEAPHLFLARKLNEDFNSPWFRMIRYGGESTSGSKRRTSLRMMQKTIQKFIKQTNLSATPLEDIYQLLFNYWESVRQLFPEEWNDHRHNLICKGIGLYSLTMLLINIVNIEKHSNYSVEFFQSKLKPLKNKINWHSDGMFAEAGGHKGAIAVYEKLKKSIKI